MLLSSIVATVHAGEEALSTAGDVNWPSRVIGPTDATTDIAEAAAAGFLAALLTSTMVMVVGNSLGKVQEVRGDGVVGEQPVLDPGTSFEYTSGTPLSTPSGIMAGTYQMKPTDGDCFDVTIPTFSLDSPHQPGMVH